MKLSQLISRRPRHATVLTLLAVVGIIVGCSGTDYSSYTSMQGDSYSNGSYSYGVGVYDSWGYYGNPYYGGGGGAVIVVPPRPSTPRPMPYRR